MCATSRPTDSSRGASTNLDGPDSGTLASAYPSRRGRPAPRISSERASSAARRVPSVHVQVTTAVRIPSSAARASTPPVQIASSSGCACTHISPTARLLCPDRTVMMAGRAAERAGECASENVWPGKAPAEHGNVHGTPRYTDDHITARGVPVTGGLSHDVVRRIHRCAR